MATFNDRFKGFPRNEGKHSKNPATPQRKRVRRSQPSQGVCTALHEGAVALQPSTIEHAERDTSVKEMDKKSQQLTNKDGHESAMYHEVPLQTIRQ
jgi:hypothetical protein